MAPSSIHKLAKTMVAACKKHPKAEPVVQDIITKTGTGTPSSFSRFNNKLVSTFERTKRVITGQADEVEEEEEEDWGCWEAMAISRSHSAASSLASSPSLIYSPSSSTISSTGSSSSIASTATDYFSAHKVTFRDVEKPRSSPRPIYKRAMFDIVEEDEDEEVMTYPVTPSTTVSLGGSPVGAEEANRFPTTPIFMSSPALPALPAGASFESSFEEAMTNIEVKVDLSSLVIEEDAQPATIAQSSSAEAVLRAMPEPKPVTLYSYEASAPAYHIEMSALPSNYEDESDDDISLYYGDGDSTLEADFSLEEDMERQLALTAIDASLQSSTPAAIRSEVVAFSSLEEYVSLVSYHKESKYINRGSPKARLAGAAQSSPVSALSMQARIRNAVLTAGLPTH